MNASNTFRRAVQVAGGIEYNPYLDPFIRSFLIGAVLAGITEWQVRLLMWGVTEVALYCTEHGGRAIAVLCVSCYVAGAGLQVCGLSSLGGLSCCGVAPCVPGGCGTVRRGLLAMLLRLYRLLLHSEWLLG